MAEEVVIPVFTDQTVTTTAPEAATAEGNPNAQNTEDQATPAKPEGEKPEETPTPEQEAKRKQNRLDRKLEKAFRQRAEAQARADFLDKQLAEERAKNTPKPEGKPTLEQFDFDPEKYAEASAKYAITQAGKELEAKQRADSQKQYQEKLTAAWEEKVERGSEKYDDWMEKVGDIKPIVPFVAALMEAENGDDIAYYLGSNPKEAERIARLPPLSQVREIGKLEAKLAAKPVNPKTPSNAVAPIKPVGGSASPSTKKLVDVEDQDEFEKRRRVQIAQRR